MLKNISSLGFTLVELMVVITILGVLSAIGLATYAMIQPGARDSRRIQDLLEVQNALEQYYAVNRKYPPGGGPLTLIKTMNATKSYYQNNVPPNDPQLTSVANYEYTYYRCQPTSGTTTSYIICAQLEVPAGKATRSTEPADGCDTVGAGGSGNKFYCLKSLSN